MTTLTTTEILVGSLNLGEIGWGMSSSCSTPHAMTRRCAHGSITNSSVLMACEGQLSFSLTAFKLCCQLAGYRHAISKLG
jgi:hypothetical protein